MCRLIRTLLVDSPVLGENRDAEKAVVEKWPSKQEGIPCVHAAA